MAVFNSRTLQAPIAAFTMAGILLLYVRSSIRRARSEAEMKRQGIIPSEGKGWEKVLAGGKR